MANGSLRLFCRTTRERKENSPDILEEQRSYTFVPNSCHGKTEMFMPISRLGRQTVLLTILVLGLFLKSGKFIYFIQVTLATNFYYSHKHTARTVQYAMS